MTTANQDLLTEFLMNYGEQMSSEVARQFGILMMATHANDQRNGRAERERANRERERANRERRAERANRERLAVAVADAARDLTDDERALLDNWNGERVPREAFIERQNANANANANAQRNARRPARRGGHRYENTLERACKSCPTRLPAGHYGNYCPECHANYRRR